jgi:DNA primase
MPDRDAPVCVIAMAEMRRKITRRLRAGTPLHVYTPDPMPGVFNERGLAHGDVVLTAGVLDALTWWCSGVRNVTTTFGSDGLRDELREALHRHQVHRVYLAFRRDRASDEAAEKMSVELNAMDIDAHRILFPAGMDANDYVRDEPSADALAELLRKAEWMGKGRPVVVATEPGHEAPWEQEPDKQPILIKPDQPSVKADAPVTVPTPTPTPGEMLFVFGDRTWRARGIGRTATHEAMKVNLFVSREGFGFHVDSIDLYSARQRSHYVAVAAVELGIEERIVKREIGEILLKLEEAHDETLTATTRAGTAERPKLTADEEKAALNLLRDPRLLDRILADLERCGVIGEADNKLVGYLAATSRKLSRPLAVLIQSSSASGKSSLMEAILDFVPEEDRLSFSALTGQSLFYLGDADLRHKVLSIAEEEGAARASYALKLLQSEGRLTIASTGKDSTTGRLVSQRYTVEGPVAIFTTTTALDVDEELLSRCIVLAVDERPEHTKAIHTRQRRTQTLDGLFDREEHAAIVQIHQNVQRLLAPVAVVNPFAAELTFADHRVRARRDHQKYLGLIEALAILHQHQRPMKTAERSGRSIQYVEVTRDNIAVADRLAAAVPSNGLDDLPPTTRHVLGLLDAMVTDVAKTQGLDRADARFSRREVRERLGIGGTQLWVHLRRLVDAEHVIVHPSRHGRGVVYELAHEGTTTSVRDRSGPIRPSFGPYSGDVRGASEEMIPRQDRHIRDPEPSNAENSHLGSTDGASYTSDANG